MRDGPLAFSYQLLACGCRAAIALSELGKLGKLGKHGELDELDELPANRLNKGSKDG
jgi:hypothetical protein